MQNTIKLSLKHLVYLIGISLLASSCVGPFNESDQGRALKLSVGIPFEVQLEGNPDSDFNWKLAQLDTNVVQMVLAPHFSPFKDNKKQGGIFSYYFQTVGKGRSPLKMVYAADDSENVKKIYEIIIDTSM